MKENLDETDCETLINLLADTKLYYFEFGENVNLSQGAAHARVKKLAATGIITASSISIDVKKLGWGIVAFLGVFLKDQNFMIWKN